MSSKDSAGNAVNTWDDSDIEVSSDDEGDKKRKSTPKQPPTNKAPPTPPNEDAQPTNNGKNESIRDDPSSLKLSLFKHYNDSNAYKQIRKRKIQQKRESNNEDQINDNNDEHIDTKPEQQRRTTINDLKSRRILYEIYNYERKWSWIDSLPTDDINDCLWIGQYTNINLFPHQTGINR